MKGPARVVKNWINPKGESFDFALLLGDQCIDTETDGWEEGLEEQANLLNAALLPLMQKARDEALEEAGKAVPASWLDPILSGPKSVKLKPHGCPEIESLLGAVRSRILSLKSSPAA